MADTDKFIQVILNEIFNPIVRLLFILAIVYFLWGIAMFIWNATNDAEREKGKQHMLWGIIGVFIMAAAEGIIVIIKNTIGVP